MAPSKREGAEDAASGATARPAQPPTVTTPGAGQPEPPAEPEKVILTVVDPWTDNVQVRADDGTDYLVTRDGTEVPPEVADHVIKQARSLNVKIKKQEG
jgi:hypothetical protein